MAKSTIILKSILSFCTLCMSIAMYFAFSFFFDVFLECIPLLFLPIILIPIIFLSKGNIKLNGAIIGIVIMMLLSIAMGCAVGVIATSYPGYGIKLDSGKIDTYTYSRKFMKNNYDIDQKAVVTVWTPEGYTQDKTYPVMYVLDGDNKFHYATLKASELSKEGYDVIIVGIGYGYWNEAFARGGIVWQDEINVKGRWRDFQFADDKEPGYMPGTDFGGEAKRGKEFCDFLVNTVVKEVRERYSVDNDNSTIFGHSLGGYMSTNLLTMYDPSLNDNNPFTNFIIVDNGYLMYYNEHLNSLFSKLDTNNNSAHTTLNVYRIWGGAVNPESDKEQIATHLVLKDKGYKNLNSYIYIPSGANHSDTITIGIDNALYMIIGKDFGMTC